MYLKRFATVSEKIYIYDTLRCNHYLGNIASAATERDINAYINDEGIRDQTIEKKLAEIESNADPLIEKLINLQILTGWERFDLSYFLAAMYLRSKPTRRIYGEIEVAIMNRMVKRAAEDKSIGAVAAEVEKEQGIRIDEEGLTFFIWAAENYSDIDWFVYREYTLGVFQYMEPLARIIYNSGWSIVLAPRDFKFITSDNPAVRYIKNEEKPTTGNNFINQSMELNLPLTPELSWMTGSRFYVPHFNIKTQQVKELNRLQAGSSDRFLFSKFYYEGVERLGQEHKHSRMRLESDGVRVNVNVGRTPPV